MGGLTDVTVWLHSVIAMYCSSPTISLGLKHWPQQVQDHVSMTKTHKNSRPSLLSHRPAVPAFLLLFESYFPSGQVLQMPIRKMSQWVWDHCQIEGYIAGRKELSTRSFNGLFIVRRLNVCEHCGVGFSASPPSFPCSHSLIVLSEA